ncbi:MAG TPA: hypothetical protein VK420_19120 [Longimicrobium sp.]|nr:hypothetical protein [Longimicrobium sp.]
MKIVVKDELEKGKPYAIECTADENNQGSVIVDRWFLESGAKAEHKQYVVAPGVAMKRDEGVVPRTGISMHIHISLPPGGKATVTVTQGSDQTTAKVEAEEQWIHGLY